MKIVVSKSDQEVWGSKSHHALPLYKRSQRINTWKYTFYGISSRKNSENLNKILKKRQNLIASLTFTVSNLDLNLITKSIFKVLEYKGSEVQTRCHNWRLQQRFFLCGNKTFIHHVIKECRLFVGERLRVNIKLLAIGEDIDSMLIYLDM